MSIMTTETATLTDHWMNDDTDSDEKTPVNLQSKQQQQQDHEDPDVSLNVSTNSGKSSNSGRGIIPFRFRRRSADRPSNNSSGGFILSPRRKLRLLSSSSKKTKTKKRVIPKIVQNNSIGCPSTTDDKNEVQTTTKPINDSCVFIGSAASDSKLVLSTSLSRGESYSSSDSTILTTASDDFRIKNTKIFATLIQTTSQEEAYHESSPPTTPSSAPVIRPSDSSDSISQSSAQHLANQQQQQSSLTNEAKIVLKRSSSASTNPQPNYCGAAIFLQNYELLCGVRHKSFDALDIEEDNTAPEQRPPHSIRNLLPDDPTIQESIECVFAYEREQSLRVNQEDESTEDEKKQEDEDQEEDYESDEDVLLSPAGLQQSYQKPRSQTFFLESQRASVHNSKRSKEPKQDLQESTIDTLIQLGSCDSCQDVIDDENDEQQDLVQDGLSTPADSSKATTSTKTSAQWTTIPSISMANSSFCLSTSQCICSTHVTPSLPPHLWPQYPLLLRPTPNSGMTILGVRFAKSTKDDYLWQPTNATNKQRSWYETLYNQHWKVPLPDHSKEHKQRQQPLSIEEQKQFERLFKETRHSCCTQCSFLPINNGNELPGETLVTDFETDLFIGTLLVRLRHTNGTTREPYNDNKGYFAGLNRRYQVVIQGKFKQQISMTKCLSGFQYDRPCGRLPPKWILKGAIKVVSFFAPQLQTKFDSTQPYCLTPLGSTPQSLIVQDDENHDDGNDSKAKSVKMEGSLEEPIDPKDTLLGEIYDDDTTTSLQRARYRKKSFDKFYIRQSPFPQTDLNKVYTFEFLQHLIDFNDLALDLGSLLGKLSLKDILDGQPLQIMAKYNNDDDTSSKKSMLWSFELWHANLVPDSLKHDHSKK